MDIRDLRFFCLTAEIEHVSKAAERLGIAQPYLTKIIGQIEDELGAQLFDKAGRQIKLNGYGEVFYLQAKKVLAHMENLYTEMDFVLERQSRMITLMSNTEAYTPNLIVDFQKKNANYGLKVSYANREEMASAILTGDADFVLCDPPLNEDAFKNIATELVFHETACALLPPKHELLGRSSIRFEDLQGERLITATKGGAMRGHVDAVFEKYCVRPRIVCETHDLNLIIQAVESGLGYAFICYSVLDRFPELRDRCVEIDSMDKYGVMGLSYNRLSIENRNISDFRHFSVEYFKKLQEHIDKQFGKHEGI